MSIITSGRILPSNIEDDEQSAFLVIPGKIQNNVYNSETKEYNAPLLHGHDMCSSSEIRLNPLDKTISPYCDEKTEHSKYFLPSLALSVMNNVNGTISIVDPFDAKENLTGKIQNPCSSNMILCDDSLSTDKREVDVPLYQDGILTAVYTINFYNNYIKDEKPVYEYIISPYSSNELKNINHPCKESLDDIKEIKSTEPFSIDSKEKPYQCVSLLLHGSLFENHNPSINPSILPSSFTGCIQTELFWVGIKLYYTNYEKKMCLDDPICLNITNIPHSQYAECFTPYFAKTEKIQTSIPKSENEIKIIENNDLRSEDFISYDIVLISNKIDVTTLLHDPKDTHFIVLLPNTLLSLT